MARTVRASATGALHMPLNDTRPDSYRPAEAHDAWDRTLKLFAQHFG
jgi:dienelactone hydrolase